MPVQDRSPVLPISFPSAEFAFRRIAEAVNQLFQGKSLNTGTVTMTQQDTSTIVYDARIGEESVVLFMPVTESAGDLFKTSGNPFWVSAQEAGQVTVSHQNSNNDDLTFRYVVIG